MADEERTETGMDFAENDDLLSTDSHSIVRFSFDDTSSMVASIAEELRNSMTEMEEKGKEEEEGEGKGGEGKEGEEGEEGKEEKKVILFFNVPLHGHVNPTLDLGSSSLSPFPSLSSLLSFSFLTPFFSLSLLQLLLWLRLATVLSTMPNKNSRFSLTPPSSFS